MSALVLKLPPKSAWYAPVFKDRTTKLAHVVITTRRSYRRKDRSRAVCGIKVKGMWPRPGGGMDCPKCLSVYEAMDVLLSD